MTKAKRYVLLSSYRVAYFINLILLNLCISGFLSIGRELESWLSMIHSSYRTMSLVYNQWISRYVILALQYSYLYCISWLHISSLYFCIYVNSYPIYFYLSSFIRLTFRKCHKHATVAKFDIDDGSSDAF